jgi:hypothetical protein
LGNSLKSFDSFLSDPSHLVGGHNKDSPRSFEAQTITKLRAEDDVKSTTFESHTMMQFVVGGTSKDRASEKMGTEIFS